MNTFVDTLLKLKQENKELQERIFEIREQQDLNNRLFSDTVFDYVKEHFPEKLKGMIEPERSEDKQFYAWSICDKEYIGIVDNKVHKGNICFEVLGGYEKYIENDPDEWEPLYYERVIYLEELSDDDSKV